MGLLRKSYCGTWKVPRDLYVLYVRLVRVVVEVCDAGAETYRYVFNLAAARVAEGVIGEAFFSDADTVGNRHGSGRSKK